MTKIMINETLKLALEALEAMQSYAAAERKGLRICDEAITALREALAEQPAQQELKIDMYRSFEQWKSGNVLEHGVPRTEHYSEAQLDLVEMGWNYGYDAGRAVEQALDKKAENARELGLDYEPEQEPVAIEHCIWARNGNTPCPHTSPPQRTWVGLTDEEKRQIFEREDYQGWLDYINAIEAKLRSKNT